MKYPAYPDYQPSDVPWIGQKPSHWQVMKLNHMARLKSGSTITSADLDENGIYPVYGGNGVRGSSAHYTHEGAYALIGRQGAECGNINYAEGKFWASEHAVVVHPDRPLHHRWLGETLRAMNLNQYSQSAAQPGLSVEVIGRLKLPFPPLAEQEQIARFLDWRTAQIDALIAKKQALLDRMREEQDAVVTGAVTKGLAPNQPTNPSGVPWLGDVPRHWEVKRLKWAVTFQRGHDLPADDRNEGDIPLVSSSGISAVHDTAVAKAPGIVTGRYGTIGVFHLIEQDYWPLNTTLYSIDLHGNNPVFLCALLENLAPLFLLNAKKSAVPGVDRNDLHQIEVALPPREEQDRIADHLTKYEQKIKAVRTRVSDAIERLTEYRAALITAAVTGQIDVRGVKVPVPV